MQIQAIYTALRNEALSSEAIVTLRDISASAIMRFHDTTDRIILSRVVHDTSCVCYYVAKYCTLFDDDDSAQVLFYFSDCSDFDTARDSFATLVKQYLDDLHNDQSVSMREVTR